MELWERILDGDIRAAARLMRMLDDQDPRAFGQLSSLFPYTGRTRVIGLTGSSGVGKSTLVDCMIQLYRAAGKRVGVVAVDPTSPFSGGAILGDRVRMQRHSMDEGVFIRSLATRGMMGGLSASSGLVVQVMDAMGFDRVLLETVGVGQDEVDVVDLADVTVVILAPGLGDEVQAHKAGLLEVADILVVNKGDLEGADNTVAELRLALDLAQDRSRTPALLKVSARERRGVQELLEHIEVRLQEMERGGKLQERHRRRELALVKDMVGGWMGDVLEGLIHSDREVQEVLARLYARRLGPLDAVAAIKARLGQTLCKQGRKEGGAQEEGQANRA